MRYFGLLWASLMRKRIRALLTLMSVSIAFLLYGLLAAVNNAFSGGVDLAGVDRLMVVNKASYMQPLPVSYGHRIAEIEGVSGVTHTTWGDSYFKEPKNYVVTLAVDAESYLSLYREILMPVDDKARWLKNNTGLAVGASLANRYGWKVGDRIVLSASEANSENGDNGWSFTVDAIYEVTEKGGNTGAVLMHYKYMNQSRTFERDTVWSYTVGLKEDSTAEEVARLIDLRFENSSTETRTFTEKAIVKMLVSQFGNIGNLVLVISTIMFFTMLLVIGSTISEGVRERRSELAVLKAMGFTNSKVLGMILAESLLLVGLGGMLGLGLSWITNSGIAMVLAQYLPLYAMTLKDLLVGVVLVVVFGVLAGWLPAQRGFRLPIAMTLRAE